MAKIGSINDLTDKGGGIYQMNFFSTPNRGFVTSDDAVLAPLWYAKVKMNFGTDWNWGSTEYNQGDPNRDPFLANNKFFRLWNPGSTHENAYVEFSARENNGCLKFQCEDANGNIRGAAMYFGPNNLKDVFKPGTTHVLEYEFKENSYLKVWLNGAQIANLTGFVSNATGIGQRISRLGLENEWNEGPKHGNNTLTLSEIVMAENKTRDQVGNTPAPSPTPAPTPTPSPVPVPPSPTPTPAPVYALKADFDALKAIVDAHQDVLGRILGAIAAFIAKWTA